MTLPNLGNCKLLNNKHFLIVGLSISHVFIFLDISKAMISTMKLPFYFVNDRCYFCTALSVKVPYTNYVTLQMEGRVSKSVTAHTKIVMKKGGESNNDGGGQT